MEFILDHLEDWKALYEEELAHLAVEAGLASQGERSPSPTLSQIRKRPSLQSKLPSRFQGCAILAPLRRHCQTEAPAHAPVAPRFDEAALPAHSRNEYVQCHVRSASSIASMEGQRAGQHQGEYQ
jgi:hypothetical protein